MEEGARGRNPLFSWIASPFIAAWGLLDRRSMRGLRWRWRLLSRSSVSNNQMTEIFWCDFLVARFFWKAPWMELVGIGRRWHPLLELVGLLMGSLMGFSSEKTAKMEQTEQTEQLGHVSAGVSRPSSVYRSTVFVGRPIYRNGRPSSAASWISAQSLFK